MPLTDLDTARFAKYTKFRDLYRGDHKKVFDLDGDDQFPPVIDNMANGIIDGLTSIVTNKAPFFDLRTSIARTRVDEITEASSFPRELRQFVREGLIYGDSLFKVFVDRDGQVKVRCVSPFGWYAVPDPDDVDTITDHVLMTKRRVQGQSLVRLELHSAGLIRHEVWVVDSNGQFRQQISLEEAGVLVPEWFGLEPEIETGVDEPLIISWSYDKLCGELYGTSELAPIMDLQRELDQRSTQEARVLTKHADPKLVLQEGTFETDENGNTVIRDLDILMIPEGQEKDKIGYMTWDAQLGPVQASIERLVEHQLHISQVSRLLLNADKTQAQTGLAVLAQLLPTLMKAEGIQRELEAPLRTTIRVAQKLSSASGRTFTPSPVKIDWGIKLPTDMQAVVQAQVMALQSGITTPEEARDALDKNDVI